MFYSNVFEGVTFRPSSQKNLFFWKYADWSYEQETRVVSALEKCQRKTVGSVEMWLREIDQFLSAVLLSVGTLEKKYCNA